MSFEDRQIMNVIGNKKINVLIVSPVAFIPDHQGSRRRVGQIVRMMQEFGFEVSFIFVRRNDQLDADSQAMSAFLNGSFVELSDKRAPSLFMPWFFKVKVASRLGLYKYCNISQDAWFFKEIGQLVKDTISAKNIDLVMIEYPFYSKVFDGIDGVLKIIDMHDVFADRYKEFLRNGKRPHPWFSVTPKNEWNAIRKADIVLAIQEGDAEVFRAYGHPEVITVEFALPPVLRKIDSYSQNLRICFLGTGNQFNICALDNFLREIHPSLLAAGINYEFIVIGTVCNHFKDKSYDGVVKLLGEVRDLGPVLQKCDALVNSLGSGTGLPIKVLDALASGLHILATEAGVRGIPLKDKLESIRTCSCNQDWIDSVVQLQSMKHSGVDLRRIALLDLEAIQVEVEKSKMAFLSRIFSKLSRTSCLTHSAA